MKICVIIPSYNVSETVGSLVEKVKAQGLDAVVVDDGSVDCTAEMAKKSGAHVLRNEKNQGKGAALKQGFHHVLKQGYDAVITMDGDGQHSPEDISNFVDQALRTDVDIVVGNRMRACKNMPLIRWLTNNFMSLLISLICWQNIRDSQCGFRLIKKAALEKLNPIGSNYEIESETIIEAHHKGLKIKFIPIRTIYSRQASKINPFIDTVRFFRYILKIFCPFLFSKR